MLAWGDDKADIIKKAVEDKVSDTLPASYLQMHNNANVCIDLAAASHLTRIQRPWLVTNCEWNDKLIRSAIVWLCMRVKKPILKLTNKIIMKRIERTVGTLRFCLQRKYQNIQ